MEEREFMEMLESVFGNGNYDLETECFDDTEFKNLIEHSIVKEIKGSRVTSLNGDLCVEYINNDNEIIGGTYLIPDIVNVSHPNERTVFVEFSDGTKEVAVLNENDTFNMETGVLICIFKRFLEEYGVLSSCSSAYNKLIKYALTKLDASKKKKEKEAKKNKEYKMKRSSIINEIRKTEGKERRELIKIIKEAIVEAESEMNKE